MVGPHPLKKTFDSGDKVLLEVDVNNTMLSCPSWVLAWGDIALTYPSVSGHLALGHPGLLRQEKEELHWPRLHPKDPTSPKHKTKKHSSSEPNTPKGAKCEGDIFTFDHTGTEAKDVPKKLEYEQVPYLSQWPSVDQRNPGHAALPGPCLLPISPGHCSLPGPLGRHLLHHPPPPHPRGLSAVEDPWGAPEDYAGSHSHGAGPGKRRPCSLDCPPPPPLARLLPLFSLPALLGALHPPQPGMAQAALPLPPPPEPAWKEAPSPTPTPCSLHTHRFPQDIDSM